MLRPVRPDDVDVFFEHQDDPAANQMAAFPPRRRAAHDAHWAKILTDPTVVARTVVEGGAVVGNVGSWLVEGRRYVGYWIGRRFWGRGYATQALADFLVEVGERPLWANVAEHNAGSIRVLTKCGFVPVGVERPADADDVTEVTLRLDETTPAEGADG